MIRATNGLTVKANISIQLFALSIAGSRITFRVFARYRNWFSLSLSLSLQYVYKLVM
ncbi:hypothetical protein DM02DRAFT_619234, partial [Periconia macrospinosa]